MSESVLTNIRTRRVVREMSDQPVSRQQIETILEAARWAPSGGNLRPIRYIVIEDAETRRLIRLVSPGMFQKAPVLVLLCLNEEVMIEHSLPASDRALLIDVGTAAQTIMLAAHWHRPGLGTRHLLQQSSHPRHLEPARKLFARNVHLHRPQSGIHPPRHESLEENHLARPNALGTLSAGMTCWRDRRSMSTRVCCSPP